MTPDECVEAWCARVDAIVERAVVEAHRIAVRGRGSRARYRRAVVAALTAADADA